VEIINTIVQGFPEWFQLKAGIPSAGSFSKIITSRGEPSKQATDYLYQLAAEKITGEHEQGYSNSFMDAMLERESESKAYYELVTGETVEQVGFIFNDDRSCGCSPDGLINRSYGLEMKNVLPKTQVKYLLEDRVPTDYVPQVQGGIFVTKFEKWAFMSYCPGLPHLIIDCEPDPRFQTALKELLEKFCFDLARIVKKLKER